MSEKIPPSDNKKNPELIEFLKTYPLPEKNQDKEMVAFELKKAVNSLYKKDAQENNFNNYNAIRKFVENLRLKYTKDKMDSNKKEAREYYLFHMAIGSTGAKTSEFDFPGEDSIERFLKLLELPSKSND